MRTAVLGAGIMGTGIAQVCAEAGLDVVLESRSLANLEVARERIRKNQRELVAAGLLGEREASAALARVRLSQDLGEAVGGADFVSENIPEDLGLKQSFFRELSRLAGPTTILSTNTSGLSITAIAAGVDRPERVVGFHWLNPPHLMSQWLPKVVNGWTVGAGHFNMMETPDQVNSMIEGFLRHHV